MCKWGTKERNRDAVRLCSLSLSWVCVGLNYVKTEYLADSFFRLRFSFFSLLLSCFPLFFFLFLSLPLWSARSFTVCWTRVCFSYLHRWDTGESEREPIFIHMWWCHRHYTIPTVWMCSTVWQRLSCWWWSGWWLRGKKKNKNLFIGPVSANLKLKCHSGMSVQPNANEREKERKEKERNRKRFLLFPFFSYVKEKEKDDKNEGRTNQEKMKENKK